MTTLERDANLDRVLEVLPDREALRARRGRSSSGSRGPSSRS
jgi:hypothetical protein